MTFDWQIAIWGTGIIFAGGTFCGLVMWRLATIERKMGNGHPGIFVQRGELKALVQRANEAHERYDEEIALIRARVHDLSNDFAAFTGRNHHS